MRDEHVDAVVATLAADGYRVSYSTTLVGRLQRQRGIHVGLHKAGLPGVDMLTEIHWRMRYAKAEASAMEDLWDEARLAELVGTSCFAMSHEWELIFLSVHASRHLWRGLKWLADVYELCSRRRINWERVADKAHRFGVMTEVEIEGRVGRFCVLLRR